MLLPDHIVCKITQRNNIKRASSCDPALKLLNEQISPTYKNINKTYELTSPKHIANCFTKQVTNTVKHATHKTNRSINRARHKIQGYNITLTTTQVLHTVNNTVAKGFNQLTLPARTISEALDMSKAYNPINIHTLIRKHIQTKIPGSIIKLLLSTHSHDPC